jgi:hypothetical protein
LANDRRCRPRPGQIAAATRHATRAIAGFLLLGSLLGSSAGAYVTIVDNGPSSNRVDVVVLGDGYTAADHAAGTYANDVDVYLDYMFSNTLNTDPFCRYRNYFNVHRIDVMSNESGADKPPEGIFVDTALGASYWYGGGAERFLYVDFFRVNTVLYYELAGADFSPEMHLIPVNDTKYGGGASTGGGYAVYAAGHSSAHEIAMHELGHAFGDLADEYGGEPGPYVGGEPGAVNVTKDPTGTKWSRWLGYDQPGIGVIGAYEGARYYDTGLYRPSENSKMRSLNRPYDAVGREKIILEIYELVDPLDGWLDNALPLVDPGDLYVDPVDDEVIDVEWYVDGQEVAGADSDTFNLFDYGYGVGDYEVSARAYDPTAFDPVDGWVRMNQSELEQSIVWHVTLTVPEPATPGLLAVGSLAGLAWALRHKRRTASTAAL